MATVCNFTKAKFDRKGGGIGFEEREPQPMDFTEDLGFGYAAAYAANGPEAFLVQYPDFKKDFAEKYMMRRAILTISGTQRCSTETFRADDIADFMETGYQDLRSFAIPGSDAGGTPDGEFLLRSFNWSDNGNGYTDVDVTYEQKGPWKLVKVNEDTTP